MKCLLPGAHENKEVNNSQFNFLFAGIQQCNSQTKDEDSKVGNTIYKFDR